MSHAQCANEFITSHHWKRRTFVISTEEEMIHQFPGHSGFHAPLLSLNAECINIRLVSGSPYSQSVFVLQYKSEQDWWSLGSRPFSRSCYKSSILFFILFLFFVCTVYLIFLPFLQVAWLFNSLLSWGEHTPCWFLWLGKEWYYEPMQQLIVVMQ